VEAGPAYDKTLAGVKKSVLQSAELIKARGSAPYASAK
jgi:hypothetical protein